MSMLVCRVITSYKCNSVMMDKEDPVIAAVVHCVGLLDINHFEMT